MDGVWMFYLCNVLPFIIDSFNQCSFSEQNLVGNTHHFILFLTLVTSCISLMKRFSNRAWPVYPLSAHGFPLMFSRNLPCFNGSRSSTFSGVNIKLRISPLSLIIRCNLNPKNHPIEYFPRSVSSSNVLWIRIFWLRQTREEVESTKLMPVQVPGSTFLMNTVIRNLTRKKVFQMFTDIFFVVMLETAETTE